MVHTEKMENEAQTNEIKTFNSISSCSTEEYEKGIPIPNTPSNQDFKTTQLEPIEVQKKVFKFDLFYAGFLFVHPLSKVGSCPVTVTIEGSRVHVNFFQTEKQVTTSPTYTVEALATAIHYALLRSFRPEATTFSITYEKDAFAPQFTLQVGLTWDDGVYHYGDPEEYFRAKRQKLPPIVRFFKKFTSKSGGI